MQALRTILPWAGLACIALAGCSRKPELVELPPPKVTVQRPETRELVDFDEYNGWLRAAETVEVRSRVRGHIKAVHFTDGEIVKEGALLFELDPRPFQSEIDRAQEQLKIYEAQHNAAVKEEARLKELLSRGGASKTQVEKAEADSISLKAQMATSEEEIRRRELELEYSRVTADISGKISRALLTAGNLVNAGGSDPLLTTIVSLDPIFIYFDIDERSLQRYRKGFDVKDADVESLKEAKIPVDFGLDLDEGFPHSGLVDFADNTINEGTATISMRGVVSNSQRQFIAGSRVRARIPTSEPYQAVLVPDTAILTDQDKKFLWVVGDDTLVERRDVTLGRLLDDGMRVILPHANREESVTPEDRVIVNGLQRVQLHGEVNPIDAPTKQASTGSVVFD